MTIDEINILNSKLRDLTRLLPNDEYINDLYKSTLKEKHKLESETLDIRPTKKELALYQISLNRKLKDNGLWNDEVIEFLNSTYKRDIDLQNRKIQLSRGLNWYELNKLQTEANNLINTMIFEHFLNSYYDPNTHTTKTRTI
jgi:hypothetical protein